MYKVQDIDGVRDATPEEIVEIEARAAQAVAPTVPERVTMRQARLALLSIGKLGDVDAAIDSLASPDKEAARIEWEYAGDVERTSPIVAMICAALNLTDSERDQLLTGASAL